MVISNGYYFFDLILGAIDALDMSTLMYLYRSMTNNTVGSLPLLFNGILILLGLGLLSALRLHVGHLVFVDATFLDRVHWRFR